MMRATLSQLGREGGLRKSGEEWQAAKIGTAPSKPDNVRFSGLRMVKPQGNVEEWVAKR